MPLINIRNEFDLQVLASKRPRLFHIKIDWLAFPLANSLLKKMNSIPTLKAVIPINKSAISFGVKVMI